MLRRDKPLRVVFIDTNPPSHLLEVSNIVLAHPYMRLKQVAEGVEGSCHRIDDNMGGFVEKETGFLVVSKVM